MVTIFRVLLCFAILSFVTSPSYAEALEVTTDFSVPTSKDAAGGGGCAGTLIIQKIVSAPQSIDHVENLYLGKSFVEDALCDVAEKIIISLNGKAYVIYAATKKYEHEHGFLSTYSNKKEHIKVSIQHIQTLKETYDPNTECTTYNRKVKVSISFKSLHKAIYGVTNSGCP